MAKTKKNKKLSTLLVVTLLAAVAIGGMLAYLQDETDTDTNVMTLGNVSIEQHEDFAPESPLYPAIGALEDKTSDGMWDNENVVKKIVTVENTGKSDAYVRTWFAFEGGADVAAKVMKNTNTTDWEWTVVGETEISENQYYVMYATYKKALPAVGDKVTSPSLYQVALEYTATNGDVDAIDVNNDGNYNVLVLSQAVQAKGFANPNEALEAAFSGTNPWDNTALVATADELKTALAAGKNVVLCEDITVASNETFTTIPAGKSVKLDMAGHTIAATLGNQDEGVNVDTAVIKVENGASLVIDGDGKFEMIPNKTLSKTSTIIFNQGNTTIESGDFKVQSGTSYDGGYIVPTIIENNAANTRDCSPTLVINGGTFTFDRNLMRNFPERLGGMTTITINGGTFTATDDKAAIWNQWGTQSGTIAPEFLDKHQITINGGTFNNVVISDDFKDVEGANQVIISDGVNITVE